MVNTFVGIIDMYFSNSTCEKAFVLFPFLRDMYYNSDMLTQTLINDFSPGQPLVFSILA